jgi:hypothetical protein
MNCLKSKAAKFNAAIEEEPAVVYVFIVSEVHCIRMAVLALQSNRM